MIDKTDKVRRTSDCVHLPLICFVHIKTKEQTNMDVNIEVSNRFASFLTDWDYEQYLLLGGYGSGKSYHVALKIILKLLEEKRTALVVRKVVQTINKHF